MKTIIAVALLMASAGVNAQVTSNTASNAQTASTAAAQNAGNAQNITFQSRTDRDTSVKTNPGIAAPGLAQAFSQFNCANSASGGVSGGFIGIVGGGPVESDQCNGRANSSLLMQMALAARATGDMDLASRFERAARNVVCQQDDTIYATMADAGLCDTIDLEGYKAQRRAGVPPQDRLPAIARTNAVGYFPDTGN